MKSPNFESAIKQPEIDKSCLYIEYPYAARTAEIIALISNAPNFAALEEIDVAMQSNLRLAGARSGNGYKEMSDFLDYSGVYKAIRKKELSLKRDKEKARITKRIQDLVNTGGLIPGNDSRYKPSEPVITGRKTPLLSSKNNNADLDTREEPAVA